MHKQTKKAVVTGLNALAALGAITTGLTAYAQPETNEAGASLAALNQASLTSIEQSWLKMPQSCKSRNAAFDPIVVTDEKLSDSAAAVYAGSIA